ncbi:MAG: hypothetical protein ACWGQW_04940 [bacterium]
MPSTPPPKPKYLQEQEEKQKQQAEGQQQQAFFTKKGKALPKTTGLYNTEPTFYGIDQYTEPTYPSPGFLKGMVIPEKDYLSQFNAYNNALQNTFNTIGQQGAWSMPSGEDAIDVWRRDVYPAQFDFNNQFREDMNIRGPSGEELPPGAVGWDTNGVPYYGDGPKGWW